jgi:hypothetical protein
VVTKAPPALADHLEAGVRGAAQAMVRKRREMRKAAGVRPFGGKAITEDESFAEYLKIRHNLIGWQDMLRSVARVKEDGRVLLPKELVEATRKYETRIREGENA